MKKKAELKQAIDAKRKSVLALFKENKIDEAKTASDELDAMIKEYEALPTETAGKVVKTMDKKKALKSAVNAYLHKGFAGMTDEQKQLVRPVDATATPGQVETVATRGAELVGEEVASFVATMDTGVYRLRTRVSEYFARTLSGKIPKLSAPTAGLVAQFDELPSGGISKGQVTFGAVNWQVRDYGLIIPVSKDLMKDAEADVAGVLSEQFFRAQVITENQMILAAIDGNGAATEVTDWTDILKAINGTAPVGGVDKVIVTNTDGYNYLDTLVDDEGRPILTQALVDNPRRIFRGYEVIQLPNAILATTDSAIPFYVGSLRDAVYFIERQGLEIEYNPYSDSAFGRNAVDIKLTCRLDCKSKFTEAVKKLTYTPSN